MIISLKKIVATLLLATLLLVPSLAFSGSVSAGPEDDNTSTGAGTGGSGNSNSNTTSAVDPQASLCGGVNDLSITSDNKDCTDTGDAAQKNVNNIVSYVINIFSIIVGIIAVIMIIVGGLKYITSGGDSNKVTSAKNSIVYAIIGLIIVALAQIIVKFVLAKATQS